MIRTENQFSTICFPFSNLKTSNHTAASVIYFLQENPDTCHFLVILAEAVYQFGMFIEITLSYFDKIEKVVMMAFLDRLIRKITRNVLDLLNRNRLFWIFQKGNQITQCQENNATCCIIVIYASFGFSRCFDLENTPRFSENMNRKYYLGVSILKDPYLQMSEFIGVRILEGTLIDSAVFLADSVDLRDMLDFFW